MARNKQYRKSKKVYAIVVDGQTEVWYFQLLKKHEKLANIDLKPALPKKKKLEEQYETMLDNIELGYDKVFWLLDFDTILKEERETGKGQPSKLIQVKEWKTTLEKQENVHVLINMPCLEYWYLLHFLDTSKSFEQCDNVIQELSKHLED